MASLTIQRDARVVAADGKLGYVEHVVIDPRTREVTDLVVEARGNKWLVPVSAVVGADRWSVTVRGTKAQYQRAPHFNRAGFRAVDEATARRGRQARARFGGAPLLDAEAGHVVIGLRAED